jgi:hypothetical protein
VGAAYFRRFGVERKLLDASGMNHVKQSQQRPRPHLWRALATLALLVLGADTARAQSGRAFDPCLDAHIRYWSGLEWLSSDLAAPRDGLLFRGTFSDPWGAPNGTLPPPGAVRVTVRAASGAAVRGTVEELDVADERTLIWRPEQALAPLADYELTAEVDNKSFTRCNSAPALAQQWAFTTGSALTPAPPQPPLQAIVYGHAWSSGVWACCEPADRRRCPDADSCFECWQWRNEPVLLPRFGAGEPSSELQQHALLYGSFPVFDSTARAVVPWASTLPTAAILPLRRADLPLTGLREVCLTAATRNVRTGQVTTCAACTPITGDDADAGIHDDMLAELLPASFSLTGPSDPNLEIGPPNCNSSAPTVLQGGAFVVAKSYHSQRLDCATTSCQQPKPAPLPAAGTNGTPDVRAASANDTQLGPSSGCQTIAGAGHALGWVWFAVLAALLRVRTRPAWSKSMQ